MEGPEQRAQHLEVMAAEGIFAVLVRAQFSGLQWGCFVWGKRNKVKLQLQELPDQQHWMPDHKGFTFVPKQ